MENTLFFKCTSCSVCLLSEKSFFRHTRKLHCKVLVCEGQNPARSYSVSRDNTLQCHDTGTLGTEEPCDDLDTCQVNENGKAKEISQELQSASGHDDSANTTGMVSDAPSVKIVKLIAVKNEYRSEESISSQHEAEHSSQKELQSGSGDSETPGMPNSSPGSGTDPCTQTRIDPNSELCMTDAEPEEPAVTVAIYKCSSCSYRTAIKCNMTRHIRTHTGEKPFSCPYCEKQYTDMSGLGRHKRSCKSSAQEIFAKNGTESKRNKLRKCTREIREKPKANFSYSSNKDYTCSFCSYRSVYIQNIKRHVRIHTGEKSFFCPHCDRIFGNKIAMFKHNKLCRKVSLKKSAKSKSDSENDIHTNENGVPEESKAVVSKRLYKCGFCLYSSKYIHNVKRHVRIHTGEKPYQCPHCEKSFSDMSGMSHHKKTCRGAARKKVTKNASSSAGDSEKKEKCLTRKIKSEARKIYKCCYCEYNSKFMCNVKRHLRKHTGEKPFACPHCEKCYSDMSALSKHKKLCCNSTLKSKSDLVSDSCEADAQAVTNEDQQTSE